MKYPDDSDGEVLRSVVDAGADMSRSMIIDFAVVAADERAARAIADLVADQGFDPSLSDNGRGGSWCVYCSKSMLATYEGVVAAQEHLGKLVAGHGGRCDGWATFGNGGPSPADCHDEA